METLPFLVKLNLRNCSEDSSERNIEEDEDEEEDDEEEEDGEDCVVIEVDLFSEIISILFSCKVLLVLLL